MGMTDHSSLSQRRHLSPQAVEIERRTRNERKNLLSVCEGLGWGPKTQKPARMLALVRTISQKRKQDKAARRKRILQLREQGRNYREIAEKVGLHHTRVWQIVKNKS